MEPIGTINMGTFIKLSNSLIPVNTFRSVEVSSSKELQPVRIYNKPSTPVGYTVTLDGSNGDGSERLYVQINDDSTWYYAQLKTAGGFDINEPGAVNIPNATNTSTLGVITIPNIYQIKFGLNINMYGCYDQWHSTGDFSNLTWTDTGTTPITRTSDTIIMTQDSAVAFVGND